MVQTQLFTIIYGELQPFYLHKWAIGLAIPGQSFVAYNPRTVQTRIHSLVNNSMAHLSRTTSSYSHPEVCTVDDLCLLFDS